MRVPIDPEVDTELDVVRRVLDDEVYGSLSPAKQAPIIVLNLARLRAGKDLALVQSFEANELRNV